MKYILAFAFALLLANCLFAQQRSPSCDSFCVLNIMMDTAQSHVLDVVLYNDNMEHTNYPVVKVIYNGDTVANKRGTVEYYAQLGKTTLTHHLQTTLASIPANFHATVIHINNYNGTACTLSYPCAALAGIDKSEMETQAEVYPNPAGGVFHIILSALYPGGVSMKVTDLYGRNVLSRTLNEITADIDLRGEAAGVYFLSLLLNGRPQTFRLLLVK